MKEEQEIPCPECNARMVLRKGKHGNFFGCSTYPTCTGTRKHPYVPGVQPTGAAAGATRRKLQESFDKFCNSRAMSLIARSRWIRENLGQDLTDISRFDDAMCKLLTAYMKVEEKLDPAPPLPPTELEMAFRKAKEKKKR